MGEDRTLDLDFPFWPEHYRKEQNSQKYRIIMDMFEKLGNEGFGLGKWEDTPDVGREFWPYSGSLDKTIWTHLGVDEMKIEKERVRMLEIQRDYNMEEDVDWDYRKENRKTLELIRGFVPPTYYVTRRKAGIYCAPTLDQEITEDEMGILIVKVKEIYGEGYQGMASRKLINDNDKRLPISFTILLKPVSDLWVRLEE